MVIFTLVYLSVFSLIYLLHTKNIETQDQERSIVFFLATAFVFSCLAGIGSSYTIEVVADSPFIAALTSLCVSLVVSIELVYCLRVFEKSSQKEVDLVLFKTPKNSSKLSETIDFLDLYRRGHLIKAPFPQGESVFWIDYESPSPTIRQMYFLTTISDCYLGLSEDEKQLIAVTEVFGERSFAEESLYAQQWIIKTNKKHRL